MRHIIQMMFQILFLSAGLLLCNGDASEDTTDEAITEVGLTSKIQNSVSRLMVDLNKIMLKNNMAKGNIVFSPVNVYEIIAILSTGAGDSAREEICNVLGSPIEVDSLEHHLVVKKLLHMVRQYSTEESSPSGCPSWREGLQLKDWKSFFSAKLKDPHLPGKDVVDELMNTWLPGTFQDPSVLRLKLTPVLKLMVSNPVYFHETWKGIPKNVLLSDTFNIGDKTVATRIINHKLELPYLNNSTMRYEAIAIPYENPHFAMYVILPYENHTLPALIKHLNQTHYDDLIENLYHFKSPVHLQIPKLNFKWAANITRSVKELGITQIFDKIIVNKVACSLQLTVSFESRGAQLSLTDYYRPRIVPRYTYESVTPPKVNPDERQFVDYFNVTETFIPFHLNRPFMFFIYNHETRVVLFSGMVFDPSRITN